MTTKNKKQNSIQIADEVEVRSYQTRDIELIHTALKTHNNVIYTLPTGGGKSVISSQIVLDHAGQKVLVLAHRKRLIDQMQKHLGKKSITTGRIQAFNTDNLDSDVIVASVRSIIKGKYEQYLIDKQFDLVVIDEAHHTVSNSYVGILEKVRNANRNVKVLGITATPHRRDHKKLEDHFDHLIVGDSITTLIERGFLCDFRTFFTPVNNIDGEVISYHSEYQMASLSTYMRKPELIQFAIDSYKLNGDTRQMIVFCCDINHAKAVSEAYIKQGYKVGTVDSSMSPTAIDFTLDQYEKGNIQILISVDMLTEGIDLPETGCIQLLRPTRSLSLYLQMVGRGLRRKKDGGDLIILDCAGCSQKYGTPRRDYKWSLDSSIDPAEEGKKDKIVVGKTKDGKFTRKEEEMQHCEVVEISEEDFFAQSENALDDAKKFNEELSESTKHLVKEFAQQIVELLDEKELWEIEPARYSQDEFSIRHKVRNRKFDFEFKDLDKKGVDEKVRVLCFKLEDSYYSLRAVEGFENQVWMYGQGATVGKVLANTLKHKLKELMTKLRHNKESVVNIKELQSRVAKFEEQRLQRQASQHFEGSDLVVLKNRLGAKDYVKEGYRSFNIVRLIGGIKYNCHVQLIQFNTVTEESEVVGETRFMKKERFFELLKDGDASFN